jgi:quinol monooxygenase YgiN
MNRKRRDTMAKLIVRHRVANFEAWQKVFLDMVPVRKRFGFTGHTLLRDAADPNLVTVINHVKDVASAKAYAASPELREGMSKAGVQGPPDVSFCEEVSEQPY